ncbi:S10 family peptidase [Steroidobacter flavus]|uniref:S10 family peptidase n=1 Tax=Steroidobacter flavus TaxID=1842136 RepID=A0ABV8SXZ4_9GAMM
MTTEPIAMKTLIALTLILACLSSTAATLGDVSPSSWPTINVSAEPGPRRFVSNHRGLFSGKKVAYQTTVAETIVKGPDGTPAASMFTFAHVAKAAGSPSSRPVIFVFNGGPGGASNTLHFGALGPKRMTPFTTAAQSDPKTPLIDNVYSVLDTADLVFIDPADTGYSRMLPGAKVDFHSIDGDSYSIAQLMIHWLTVNNRLDSPKYILGESYGTLRGVALARDLALANPKILIDGLVMVSQAIRYNGPTSIARRSSLDIVYAISRLPDAAALAWYHGKIDNKHQTVREAMDQARAFGRTEYAEALLLGNRLDATGRERIASRLAALTGIPAAYYLANNLRIGDLRRELLKDQGRVLLQFDGRETESASASVPDDQRDWSALTAGLTANMERYAERDLKVSGLGTYISVVPDPYRYEDGWSYIKAPAPTLDVVLSEHMRANTKFRLLVTQGIFDATSSTGSTESLYAMLDLPGDRTSIAYYPGGHMLYSDEAGLAQFTADVRAFVTHRPLQDAIKSVSPATPSP